MPMELRPGASARCEDVNESTMTRQLRPVRASCRALAIVAAAMCSATLSSSCRLLPPAEASQPATPYGCHGVSLGVSSERRRRRRNEYLVDMDDLMYDGTMAADDDDSGDAGGRRGGGNKGRGGGRLSSIYGRGREFDIFDTRGGETLPSPPLPRSGIVGSSYLPSSSQMAFPPVGDGEATSSTTTAGPSAGQSSAPYYSFTSSRGGAATAASAAASDRPRDSVLSALRSVRDNLPRVQLRMEPTTTLKIRKTFNIFKATVLRLGADFNYQLGVWQFRSSWEDNLIGGKLSLAGRELQLAKTWRLSVDKSSLGAQEDFVTSVRFRAAVDLSTLKAYARLGFRTERISPINVYEGFTFVKRIPLDGRNENIKLEIKANFALPEPEIEYSTENHRTFVGLGDVEVNVDELNLLFDF